MIPLLKPSCSQKEIDAVTKVLKSGWWGLGQVTEEFEKKFAEFVGAKYAVATNSATAALHMTVKAMGLHGEIIIPALTFVSTGYAALYNDCKVVLADINEETLCIDWEDVERKITKKTVGIIPVWYGGLVTFTGDYTGIQMIEDCAHAAGNPYAGKYHTACWSFHPVKNLATGDGGMITTNDEELYQKLLPMRWCGINKSTWERSQKKYGWDYDIQEVGYKYHMNDIMAAIGLAQLERIKELNNARRLRAYQYMLELAPYQIPWLTLPEYNSDSSWHLFVVKVDCNRDKFIDYMLAHGISVGVHYKPLNTYPMFPKTKLPVTDRVWKKLVSLPMYPDMTDQEFEFIIDTIAKFKE